MTTQVLEREAAPPDTGTEEAPTGATPTQETGTEREAQTGQEPNDNDTAEIGDSTDEVDPEEAAIEAKAEARAQELLEQREAERKAEADAKAAEAEQTQRAERHSTLFPTTVQGIEEAVKALPVFDAMGNPVQWTPAALDAITAPFKAAHLTIWQDSVAAVHGPIQTALKNLIPEAEYDAFKKEASGKPPEDYFRMAAERIARTTKWAKSMTLDEATKLSSKVKADVATAIDKAVKADRAKPRKAGEPAGGGTGGASVANFKNEAEARAANAAGTLDNTGLRRYLAANRS